jgi:hypothetical protein
MFHRYVDIIYNTYIYTIDIENRKFENQKCSENFNDTYVVVDTTECSIESNLKTEFSGKKKQFTWKYQTIVGACSGEILGIHGPEEGPVADAKIYEKSGLRKFLEDEDEYCLADKGYVGCPRAIHPTKKKKSSISKENLPISREERIRNKKISHFRINIERTYSYLKDWNILSTVYRGSKEFHGKIFTTCCIFYNLSNQFEMKNVSSEENTYLL